MDAGHRFRKVDVHVHASPASTPRLVRLMDERGIDLAHASTPEGFEHAVANVPEVADLVRLATRMEYAEARWTEGGLAGARRPGPDRSG